MGFGWDTGLATSVLEEVADVYYIQWMQMRMKRYNNVNSVTWVEGSDVLEPEIVYSSYRGGA